MTTRAARHRYYAYERRDGSVCYLPKLLHEGFSATLERSRTTTWCSGWGVKLLSKDEYKQMAWLGSQRGTLWRGWVHSEVRPKHP